MNQVVIAENESIEVKVRNFNELFDKSLFPVAIDSYQRAYVWGEDKVKQLVEDLNEFYKQTKKNDDAYYMGAVLLHKEPEQKKRFIIDGQQRLTTLCVLHHLIHGQLPANQDLSYSSPTSVNNIRKAKTCFSDFDFVGMAKLFNRIRFTVITVPSQDMAFTFFDTQNNRGMPLAATDLLKAYHLRAITGDKELALQTLCARRWEGVQKQRQVLGYGADFVPTLFHQFLWRSRCWSGQKVIERERFDDVLDEFQTRTIKPESTDTIPLYSSCNNRLGTALTLMANDDYCIRQDSIRLSSHPAVLPFSIRQPVSKGVGFFLYTDKYADLVQQLLNKENPEADVIAYQDLYEKLYLPLSLYLRELFLLTTAMYIDQFGYKKLYCFALWLDYLLGAIRIEKAYVFKQAPIVFLRDKDKNLLDVIAGAFRAEDVLDYMSGDVDTENIYANENVAIDNKVRGRYKYNVLAYYGKDKTHADLKFRKQWIKERIEQKTR